MNIKKSITLSLAGLLIAGSAAAMGPFGGPFGAPCGDNPSTMRAERLQHRLDLTNSQTRQIEQIFEEHHKDMEASHNALKREIAEVLTDEQLDELESTKGRIKRKMGRFGADHRHGPRW